MSDCSTRVSNELGAGNSHAARLAVIAAMSLAVIETSIVSATLFACRNVYGYVFSNEKEVIDYVTVMAPLVCISVILDSIQGVLTGNFPSCLIFIILEKKFMTICLTIICFRNC